MFEFDPFVVGEGVGKGLQAFLLHAVLMNTWCSSPYAGNAQAGSQSTTELRGLLISAWKQKLLQKGLKNA